MSILVEAIKKKDVELIKSILEKKTVKIDETIKNPKTKLAETTALILACRYSLDIVNILIENGADVNKAAADRNFRYTPLYVAADVGNLDLVKLLIEKGAKVNQQIYDRNFTALHAAVARDNVDITKFLISQKANVNILSRGTEGTPLHHAALKGKGTECAEILLKHGAKIDLTEPKCPTVFYTCVREDKVEMMKFLLEHGADCNYTYNDQTPVIAAVEWQKNKSLKFLLEHKCEKNTLYLSRTPLIRAIHYSNVEAVKLLTEYGADIDIQVTAKKNDKGSLTALLVASSQQHAEIIKILLGKEANVNLQNDRGDTALHYVIYNGLGHKKISLSCVKTLLKYKANPNQKNNEGISPFYYYIKKIFRNGWNDGDILKAFVEHDADLKSGDAYGETPLHQIAKDRNMGTVERTKQNCELLIKYGSDVNCSNIDGQTPLHFACMSRNLASTAVVAYLIENGAEIQKNTRGEFPYHLAALKENMRIFIDKGCDFNAQTNDGDTALHLMVKEKNNSCINCILENVATIDVTLQNNEGQTICDIAEEKGLEYVFTILERTKGIRYDCVHHYNLYNGRECET